MPWGSVTCLVGNTESEGGGRVAPWCSGLGGMTEGKGRSVWHREVDVKARVSSRLADVGTIDVSVEPWGMVGGQVWACGGLMIWRHLGIVVQHVSVNGCFVILGSSDPR